MLLNRKFGIEMEGYITKNPGNVNLGRNISIKRDASLGHSNWSAGNSKYGVEVVTNPIRETDKVLETFALMKAAGWSVDERAGTHVHIEIRDYSNEDKAKLLRFAKGIERIIFMFVKENRDGNRYCGKLSSDYRKLFQPQESPVWRRTSTGERVQEVRRIPRTYPESTTRTLQQLIGANGLAADTGRYYWLNMFSTRFPTVEFRIFHAIERATEAVFFISLAHNIVETAKAMSPEQIEFVIMSLYESSDAETAAVNLLEMLGFEGAMTTKSEIRHLLPNRKAVKYLDDKLKRKRATRLKQANEYMKSLAVQSVG